MQCSLSPSLPTSHLLRSAYEGCWKGCCMCTFFRCLDYCRGKKGISIIQPVNSPTFCYLKCLKAKKLNIGLKHRFPPLSLMESGALGPMGQMSRYFLAILNEATTREGFPLPCRLDLILTVTSFPCGLVSPGRLAGGSLSVIFWLEEPHHPMTTAHSSWRAKGTPSLV